jgi:hypothetical protein
MARDIYIREWSADHAILARDGGAGRIDSDRDQCDVERRLGCRRLEPTFGFLAFWNNSANAVPAASCVLS